MKRVVDLGEQQQVPTGFNDFTAEALITTCDKIQSAIGDGGGLPLKLEVFTVAAFLDEGEWSSAWLQFIALAMRSKDGSLPRLSNLQLDVPAALRYMLSEDAGPVHAGATVTVKCEDLDEAPSPLRHIAKTSSDADKQYLGISK